MKEGDRVWWVSQSGSLCTEKHGVIVAVVPPDQGTTHYIPEGMRSNSSCGFGMRRSHESYLVKVDGKGNGVYWPRVKNLRGEA